MNEKKSCTTCVKAPACDYAHVIDFCMLYERDEDDEKHNHVRLGPP